MSSSVVIVLLLFDIIHCSSTTHCVGEYLCKLLGRKGKQNKKCQHHTKLMPSTLSYRLGIESWASARHETNILKFLIARFDMRIHPIQGCAHSHVISSVNAIKWAMQHQQHYITYLNPMSCSVVFVCMLFEQRSSSHHSGNDDWKFGKPSEGKKNVEKWKLNIKCATTITITTHSIMVEGGIYDVDSCASRMKHKIASLIEF